jgi:hypothetical protein
MITQRAAGNVVDGYELDGFELPADLQMPTTAEVERDLALGKPGWKSRLRSPEREPSQRVHRARRAHVGWPARVLVLGAGVALGAAISGGVTTAFNSSHQTAGGPFQEWRGNAPTTGVRVIWTARGPIAIDEVIKGIATTEAKDCAPMRSGSHEDC